MPQGKRRFALLAEHDATGPEPGSEAEYGSVAAILREARERAGYDLRDVAETLRIRYVYLEAIEAGRFKELPGLVYAVGFVRTYADLLHLDAEEIVRRFKDEVAGIDTHTQLNFPAPVPEGKVPGGALLLIALLLAVLAYGGWYYLSSQDRNVADFLPDLPARFAALLDQGASGDAEPSAATTPSAVAETPAAVSTGTPEEEESEAQLAEAPVATTTDPTDAPGRGEPDQSAGESAPATASDMAEPQEPAAEAAPELPDEGTAGTADTGEAADAGVETTGGTLAKPADQPAEPAAPTVSAAPTEEDPAGTEDVAALPPPPAPPATEPRPAENASTGSPAGETGIVVTATAQSWVQVRDSNGNLVMTRILEPGEVYRVPNTPGLRMVTGNAGGIRITVDGVETPSLGGMGDVVRNIVLDGERLLAGTAVGR